MKHLILSIIFVFSVPAFAEDALPPNLPEGPPEIKIDPGQVQKEAENLMKACRISYEKMLKKNRFKPELITKASRDVCLCIAKDVKRRQDVEELQFLAKNFRDQIDDDAELSEDESLFLHTLDSTEANCRRNTKYRFGDREPTFLNKSDKTQNPEAGEKNATSRKIDPKKNRHSNN